MTKRHTFFAVFVYRKIFFQNLGLLLLFFLLLLPCLERVVSFYDQDAVWRGSLRVEDGINKDLKYVKNQVAEISQISDIATFIQNKNAFELLSILQDETKKRQLSGALATDDDGVVIVRSKMVSERGDYFFDNNPAGRKLSNNEEPTSVERLAVWPLGIESGHLIKKNGVIVGSIVGMKILDDRYAVSLKEKTLPSDAEMIIYSKEKGVIGSSFDPSLKQILTANFNTGTKWMDWVNKGNTFKIGGMTYLAKNIRLLGTEETMGSIIVFYPLRHTLVGVGAGFVAVILFIIFFVILRFIRKRDLCRSFFFILFICCLFVFGTVFSFSLFLLNKNVVVVLQTPYTLYNSTVDIEPSFGIFSMEEEHRVTIRVETGGEPINVANIEMSYDPEKIEVNEIITANSFCDPDFFLKKNIDENNGKISIVCGIKFPGFFGTTGIIAELLIQPRGESETSLVFNEGTRILASDGLGTDVLRQSIGGSYQFIEKRKETAGSYFTTVFSPTHPNTERWYNNNSPRFTWKGEEGSQYAFSLDTASTSALHFYGGITKEREVIFTNLSDGVYYFHIAQIKKGSEALGPITTKKVMIDMTPPEIPTIRASESNVPTGQIVRVEFGSKDSLSGLQKNFYVKFNGGLFLPLTSPLMIAYPKGHHIIIVRAFDVAGNYSDGSIPINAY